MHCQLAAASGARVSGGPTRGEQRGQRRGLVRIRQAQPVDLLPRALHPCNACRHCCSLGQAPSRNPSSADPRAHCARPAPRTAPAHAHCYPSNPLASAMAQPGAGPTLEGPTTAAPAAAAVVSAEDLKRASLADELAGLTTAQVRCCVGALMACGGGGWANGARRATTTARSAALALAAMWPGAAALLAGTVPAPAPARGGAGSGAGGGAASAAPGVAAFPWLLAARFANPSMRDGRWPERAHMRHGTAAAGSTLEPRGSTRPPPRLTQAAELRLKHGANEVKAKQASGGAHMHMRCHAAVRMRMRCVPGHMLAARRLPDALAPPPARRCCPCRRPSGARLLPATLTGCRWSS